MMASDTNEAVRIANWLKACPGPISSPTYHGVIELAQMASALDDLTFDDFRDLLWRAGYSPEQRRDMVTRLPIIGSSRCLKSQMTNQEVFDALVRREITLRGLTRGELTDLLEWLDEQDEKTFDLIRRARGIERRRDLEALLAEIRTERERVFDELSDRLSMITETVAKKESRFVVALFASLALHPASDAVVADIVHDRPINGQLFEEWLTALAADDLTRIVRALRLASVSGGTVDDAVTQVRSATATTARNVTTITESLITHGSSQAREETLDNADEVTGWRWVSILDGRTSAICRARSGRVYPANQPHPTPPAHPRCRSSIVPVLRGEGGVQEENYGQWLRRQPDDVQNEILGPSRGKLFRSGRYQLDDFVEEPSGRTLRLDELTP